MTATLTFRLTPTAGPIPARGTLPAAANKLFIGGGIVQVDASANATPAADGNGFPAAGIAAATYDNRTGSEAGGLAGDIDVEIEYGVFGFFYTGTPVPGENAYVVDNQTVSDDSDSSARGVAGVVSEVRDGLCYVWMGPHVAALFSDDSAVEADVTQLQTDVDALQADALTAQAFVPLPITTWLADGAPMLAFADGTQNGLALVDSEAIAFRFNPVGQDTSTLGTTVPLPPELDDAADIVLHVMCARIGASDVTTVLSGSAFFHTVGAAHTADADAITVDSAAIDAATTVIEEITLTIAAADVPAAPCDLTILFAPSAALDADDLIVTSAWLEYTRKLLVA